MYSLVQLMRPHQYLKNGFVLMGVLFSHQWYGAIFIDAIFVFIAFCMMASSVYIMNDITDIDADLNHPTKRFRPLPSGRIKKHTAYFMGAFLFFISIGFSLSVGLTVLLCTLVYFILNILYSRWLKHIVILDVFVISSGFMLRILAGTLGLGIDPSEWLLLCGLTVTLFLGFSKRHAELLALDSVADQPTSSQTRKVLDDYSPALLEQLTSVTAACTLISYGLYTVSPGTVELHGTSSLIYTLPFVAYGIFRYLFLLHHKNSGNDTARDLMTDPHLLATIALWILTILWILS